MGPIGREAELALVRERLRDRRLVTLVGPGGIGKTTLARAAARASAGDFPLGLVTVDLTRVASEDGVRESIAAQLGFESFPALLDAPGEQPALVLLDNCEHVVDAAADAVAALLDACEMPTVLATSRIALEVPGEVVVPLGPLGLPPAGSLDAPAVTLFLARAAEAGVHLEATDDVGELCRRLDGVPLAIELAAARTRAMTPAEILRRLEADLGVLERPRRRSAARHRSLTATIDWSHGLLARDEQALFARLSTIPGPFTLDFAHAVAGDVSPSPARTADLLDGLVAASMVVASPAGEVTSYRILETLRSYGRARLDEAGLVEDVEARLVDHVVERMTDVIARGATTWRVDALQELLALYDATAASIRWCLAHDAPDRALVLTAVLWGAVHQAHTEEIGRLAEDVLARWPDHDHPLWADAAATAATCRYMLGDDAGAVALAERALARADRSPFAGATLRRAIAQAVRASGDAEGSLGWFREAAATAEGLGLRAMALEARAAEAQVLADLGEVEDALVVLDAARAEAEAEGLVLSPAWLRAVEGTVRLRIDPAEAAEILRDTAERCARLDYAAGTSVSRRGLALAALLQGDLAGAARHVLDLLDGLLAAGSTSELRAVLDVAAPTLAQAGRTEPGRALAATALSLPVVSITASVGHELAPLDPAGAVPLEVREAILVVRRELDALLSSGSAPRSAAGPATAVEARVGVLRRLGDVWEVGFEGEVVTVRGSKGLEDLATLVRRADREVSALELVGGGLVEGSTGEVLDDAARRAYESRLRDLQDELDEAEAAHDRGRAARARAEMDALVDQLVEGYGLGGRPRTRGSSTERARSAVTQRLRSTIRRLEQVHPALGRHLRASVRTGTYCAYDPEVPTAWRL